MVTCLRSVLMKPEHEAWLDLHLGEADRKLRGGHRENSTVFGTTGKFASESLVIPEKSHPEGD